MGRLRPVLGNLAISCGVELVAGNAGLARHAAHQIMGEGCLRAIHGYMPLKAARKHPELLVRTVMRRDELEAKQLQQPFDIPAIKLRSRAHSAGLRHWIGKGFHEGLVPPRKRVQPQT